jgi:hypothetical protein
MERRLLTKCGTENGNGELNRRLGGGNERKPASMEVIGQSMKSSH